MKEFVVLEKECFECGKRFGTSESAVNYCGECYLTVYEPFEDSV